MLWIGRRQPLGDQVGEQVRLLKAALDPDRNHDVKAPGAGGLDEGDQPELVEQALQPKCGAPHQVEVVVRRVEVEHDLVRLLRVIDLREPDVSGDQVVVCQVDERSGIVDTGVGDRATPVQVHCRSGNP